jgi:hypothetical protein
MNTPPANWLHDSVPTIHEADYDDPKEPYAFFGLASYWVQCFEQSLILLIVALKVVSPTPITETSFEEVFEKLDRNTLGGLIRQISRLTDVDDNNLTTLFSELLPKRNYLMHQFFDRNADKWFSDVGRQAMIDELRALAQAFQDGDRILKKIYEPLWHKLGVTEEVVRRELEKLKDGI